MKGCSLKVKSAKVSTKAEVSGRARRINSRVRAFSRKVSKGL